MTPRKMSSNNIDTIIYRFFDITLIYLIYQNESFRWLQIYGIYTSKDEPLEEKKKTFLLVNRVGTTWWAPSRSL